MWHNRFDYIVVKAKVGEDYIKKLEEKMKQAGLECRINDYGLAYNNQDWDKVKKLKEEIENGN